MGLVLEDDNVFEAPKSLDTIPGHPAARMTRWRRELRNGHVTHVNNFRVKTISEVKTFIQKQRHYEEPNVDIRFAVPTKAGIAENGQPQLFHDQMLVVAEFEMLHAPLNYLLRHHQAGMFKRELGTTTIIYMHII